MNNNIEIEAKALLSRDDYNKVYAYLGINDTMSHVQTNFYIDSKERVLKKNDVALRIRETLGRYVLTMKTPMSEGLLEKNQELKEKEALEMINLNKFPIGDVYNFLEVLDIDPSQLVVLASLSTKRAGIDKGEEEISLDINTYGSKVDYELEVDSSAMALAEKRINEILTPLGIKYTINNQSKQARALAAFAPIAK